ncbi:MAG: hypothetical protein ABSC94_19725 [Polyangiaceae bacterium]
MSMLAPNLPVADSVQWLVAPPLSGARMGIQGENVVVEWSDVGRLVATTLGDPIVFSPRVDLSEAYQTKFLLTSVLGCLRYLAGEFSLHGSAVRLPAGVVALIGDSGQGKSTTAMALMELHGAQFVADDLVAIDWIKELPSLTPKEDSVWLTRESADHFGVQGILEPKGPHTPSQRCSTAERLVAIVDLTFDTAPGPARLQRLGGQDGFVALSRSHVCYALDPARDARRNLEARAAIARTVPIYRLLRRRSLDALHEATRLIVEGQWFL